MSRGKAGVYQGRLAPGNLRDICKKLPAELAAQQPVTLCELHFQEAQSIWREPVRNLLVYTSRLPGYRKGTFEYTT